mmetsp:Transcript_29235/g.49135  ORF Transcript_29235/g.49135 Transcript_29235/m.49135 type:complete len:140 (-) Transcript_29235:111-530(-)
MAENPVSEPCELSAVSKEQQAGGQGSDQMCPGVSRRDFDTCCKVLELFKQNKEAFEDPKVKPLRTLLREFGEQFQNVRSNHHFSLSDEKKRARQTCKVAHTGRGLTALTDLNLASCGQVSDNGLIALQASLPNLKLRMY